MVARPGRGHIKEVALGGEDLGFGGRQEDLAGAAAGGPILDAARAVAAQRTAGVLQALGTVSADIRGRLGESLEIMRALWTGGVVDHAGEHFTLTGAQQRPVPTRPIPITVGGVGRNAVRPRRRNGNAT